MGRRGAQDTEQVLNAFLTIAKPQKLPAPKPKLKRANKTKRPSPKKAKNGEASGSLAAELKRLRRRTGQILKKQKLLKDAGL